jgi:hypothetical protein
MSSSLPRTSDPTICKIRSLRTSCQSSGGAGPDPNTVTGSPSASLDRWSQSSEVASSATAMNGETLLGNRVARPPPSARCLC